MRDLVERLFHLRAQQTSVRTEVLGGVTTFLTMAYIIVLNPAILLKANLALGPSTVATILTAVFGCVLMGLYANRPIAVAPYMGENAFLAVWLLQYQLDWRLGLGAVFVSGAAFLVLTLLGIRAWLVGAISHSLKHSFAVGIGLFLILIGLYETELITSFVTGRPGRDFLLPDGLLRRPEVPLKIGRLSDPRALLALFGFVLIVTLMYWRVRGALLLGIIVTAALGLAWGQDPPPENVVALPWSADYSLSDIAFQLDIAGVFQVAFLPILLTLFLMNFLDTLGTLVGVGAAGGLLDEKGDFPEIEKPMLVDSVTCMFAAVVGTSTSGAYIESATGIREGARTGLAAVTTAGLFALALFFLPLAESLQKMSYAYGPALIAVGVLMLGSVSKIRFDDLTESVPAVATIVMMIFTYNIANGLTAGLTLYPVLKVLAGRHRELHPGAILLGILCLIYFVFGIPH